jgi:hypothetical protein
MAMCRACYLAVRMAKLRAQMFFAQTILAKSMQILGAKGR